MHPRFAASLFALGLADLAYANLGLAPKVLAAAALESPAPLPEKGAGGGARPARAPIAPPSSSGRAEASAQSLLTPGPSSVELTPAAIPGSAATPALPVDIGTQWVVPFPAPNTAELTAAAEEELTQLAARLRAHPSWRIGIVGHTDDRGEQGYNRDLGQQRARVVAEALALAGVAPEQLETRSRGEEEPKVLGSTEDARALNRRAEIAIRTQGSRAP